MDECFHANIFGPLKMDLSAKLPFKEPSVKRNIIDVEMQRINFFKGALPLSGTIQIMIAIRSVSKPEGLQWSNPIGGRPKEEEI
jgi:hypothetical protein